MERLRPWLTRSGMAYAALAVALIGLAWRFGPGVAPPTQPVAASPVQVQSTPSRPRVVHVAGAVRKPGVYEITAGGRVVDAIAQAGGAAANANLSGVNLAAPLQDGQQVLIPAKTAVPAGRASAGAVSTGQVSLSSASAADLDQLDGIGPTLAARIVAWRDQHGGFSSVDQLLEVPGIGQSRLDAIRARLTP